MTLGALMTSVVHLQQDDLEAGWLDRALEARQVAWDIETTGLDWRTDQVRTCQVGYEDQVAVVQLREGHVPARLQTLLQEPSVQKVFHHAAFDLRFMVHHWGAAPKSVACTKVAAKIVSPRAPGGEYSLKHLLRTHLRVDIDKELQVSDWSSTTLSSSQLEYAANDVRYLHALLEALLRRARERGVHDLVAASFDYLPSRVRLDLAGAGDVFTY